MLPITKQSSCLGSHIALSLVNHRPVCMSCLQMKKHNIQRINVKDAVSNLFVALPDMAVIWQKQSIWLIM